MGRSSISAGSPAAARPPHAGAPWLAVLLIACASAPARVPDPAATATQFVAALRADQPDAAYTLLDPRLRASLGRARFLALWRENRAELRELGERLARIDVAPKA